MKHVISCGAGVQSSTLTLMAEKGEITPKPDCGIFSDTRREPGSVYVWLEWLRKQVSFPIYTVTAGDLGDAPLHLRTSKRSGNIYTKSLIPTYIAKPDGKKGMLMRRCTRDYKLMPIMKKLREICGVKRARKGMPILATSWIGISLDEAHRMKPAFVPFVENRWPLIELRMTRQDCLNWMERNGYPRPPRSACVFCPYHSDLEWLRLKTDEPNEFEAAAKWEEDYQNIVAQDTVTEGIPFLHSSLKPLRTVDFQIGKNDLQFGNECEGMCGV